MTPESWNSGARGDPIIGNYSVNTFPRKLPEMELLLRDGAFCRTAPRLYNEDLRQLGLGTRVEAGSNTSTVTLRVVGGDEKEVSNLRQ
jgi:hypothetical protein